MSIPVIPAQLAPPDQNAQSQSPALLCINCAYIVRYSASSAAICTHPASPRDLVLGLPIRRCHSERGEFKTHCGPEGVSFLAVSAAKDSQEIAKAKALLLDAELGLVQAKLLSFTARESDGDK